MRHSESSPTSLTPVEKTLEADCLSRSRMANSAFLSSGEEKGWKVEAVGDSFGWLVFEFVVMKGSFSALDMTLPKVLEGNLEGVVSGEACTIDLRRREDLVALSSGEKAVNLVSGVPLKESAAPTEE